MSPDTCNPINDNFSFVDHEHQVLAFWREQAVFEQSLAQTRGGKPYVFYDGPPFATGLPHHGHLVGSILKDIVPRYFTMNGRYVQRRFGWDCHGLPIEHEIDKSLGLSASEAVAQLGIKGYNDECRRIVQRYTAEWESTITRVGRWVDFENDYRTMEPWYMESVWWVVKQLWEKDLIYQGLKVVPFSTALGTVLSNFEAGSNYRQVRDPAVTVLFKLADEDCYLAAWTTTPWTLPANLGLCVGSSIEYVKVRDRVAGITLVMSRTGFDRLGEREHLSVIGKITGRDLVGKRYQPLFPYFTDLQNRGAFQVLADDYVSTDDGTGIVHLAPAFGADDLRIFKAAAIDALVCPIDMAGRFTAEVADFAGQKVKDADRNILRALKHRGHVYREEVITHSYPFCPRSDTPIIYRTIPSWYVRVESLRADLVRLNRQINWVPEHLQSGRMGNWLAAANDWAISRNRYWGTPLPIWVNDVTQRQICIGSREELASYTGAAPADLHREHVDPLSFTRAGEPGTYRRVSEVLDCWFESGAMPYAQLHYPFENQSLFGEGFPAEFIAEGLDQTRGWFYTLSVLSCALFDKPAFKNVIVNGIVMAADGKKMSKRLRNYTPPDELMETYGADALRLYLINSGLVRAQEQAFADAGVQDMVRRVLLPWLNGFRFLQTYAGIDQWQPGTHRQDSDNILDQWLLSRLQSLQATVAEQMQQYRLYHVVPALFAFIEDLTNGYIRLNRSRFWAAGMSADKQAAYTTLYTCLLELSRTMAPFTPFLSETLYRRLIALDTSSATTMPLSVHLCAYPQPQSRLIKPELERGVERMQQVILLGRQKRNQVKIKTKTPLAKLTIIHSDLALLEALRNLDPYIRSELNVKQVYYCNREEDYILLRGKPNSPVLGKRLGRDFAKYRALIENLTTAELARLQASGEVELDGERFRSDDILVFRQAKTGTEVVCDRDIAIELDCRLTDDLIAEGWAREVISCIQKTRKRLKLQVTERIEVTYQAEQPLHLAIRRHLDHIAQETLACRIVCADMDESGELFEIDGSPLRMVIGAAT
ncbi:isoleucine--tRNA ligase [Exilibacterium tricleocarpae]|uniref:isoleucine--tRNA ligase n=1 Tax=Exilibacterium tricleocarpae TaxID=2591008 RepID=UPI001C5509C3|nr:isoleucine--tRNA ligase [Exilibacterium tricleocarpae]